MIKFIPISILIISSLLFANCKDKKDLIDAAPAKQEKKVGLSIPYDLDNPNQEFLLERDLKEISGLAFSASSGNLLAINDEKGYIYLLDPMTAKIQSRIDFGKSKDYEGIAYREGQIYIVESNGDFVVVNETSQKRVDKYKTNLSRKNDIEGLTYNPETATFLIAAKGQGGVNKKTGKKKSIFNLNPKTQAVSEIPFIKVNLQNAIDELNKTTQKGSPALTNYQLSRVSKFSPSGIAVHPVTNTIYVLSSRGKLLVEFDQKGSLKGVNFLDEKRNAQPEGICFGLDNTLYISNEGRAGKATLLSYEYKK